MVKSSIVPKRYVCEARSFTVRTAAGYDVHVRFIDSDWCTNTRNSVFHTLGFYPRIPGGTECGEIIHQCQLVKGRMF